MAKLTNAESSLLDENGGASGPDDRQLFGGVELVAGTRQLAPGLAVAPAPGHTAGHQMLHLVSAGRHALLTGDCFHHPIRLIEPSIAFGKAEDFAQAMAMRHRRVTLAGELDAVLIAAHLPAPFGVRVQREGEELHFSTG